MVPARSLAPALTATVRSASGTASALLMEPLALAVIPIAVTVRSTGNVSPANKALKAPMVPDTSMGWSLSAALSSNTMGLPGSSAVAVRLSTTTVVVFPVWPSLWVSLAWRIDTSLMSKAGTLVPSADASAGAVGSTGVPEAVLAGVNTQLPAPLLSVSKRISGSTKNRRLTCTPPLKRGRSATSASKRLTETMSGPEPQAALDKRTPSTTTAGEKPMAKLRSPSMVNSRPVASLTMAEIMPLYWLKSMDLRTATTPTTSAIASSPRALKSVFFVIRLLPTES